MPAPSRAKSERLEFEVRSSLSPEQLKVYSLYQMAGVQLEEVTFQVKFRTNSVTLFPTGPVEANQPEHTHGHHHEPAQRYRYELKLVNILSQEKDYGRCRTNCQLCTLFYI